MVWIAAEAFGVFLIACGVALLAFLIFTRKEKEK